MTALQAVEAEPEAALALPVIPGTAEATGGWLTTLTGWVEAADGWVWGVPLIAAILLTGVFLTFRLRFAHLLNLRRAFRFIFSKDESSKGDVSPFGALCTALSATIGTGNIVGVATAIGTGGPGALFWMQVAAVVGMATKYAEGLLAVKYREILPDGRVLGGPFMYIEKGLGPRFRPLAVAFAFFGALAGIMGIGTLAQIHGITSAVQRFFDPGFNPADMATGVHLFGATYSTSVVVAGFLVTLCVGLVVIGGLRRIARVAMVVVPFMAAFYIVACAFILLGNLSKISAAIELVVRAAFNPAAFTGGMVGSLFVAVQMGVARGIFSNEAGLGSEPIAAAAARTSEPARQGLVCMTGTFVDTIVVCTMTGLAIVITGAWEPSLGLKGVDITIAAFNRGLAFLPKASVVAPCFLMVSLALFAFTTILGWNYYSERCLEYLVGPRRRRLTHVFRLLYVAVVFAGPYFTVSVVWCVADVFNGLMAFPNLVALLLLSPVVRDVTRDFLRRHP
ncbi:MAG: alanine:cation symporter family protein [Kiritimatiellae bacterium]|nr:alanine:cation symporter family protein [Kiritimatiellia bacterium]